MLWKFFTLCHCIQSVGSFLKSLINSIQYIHWICISFLSTTLQPPFSVWKLFALVNKYRCICRHYAGNCERDDYAVRIKLQRCLCTTLLSRLSSDFNNSLLFMCIWRKLNTVVMDEIGLHRTQSGSSHTVNGFCSSTKKETLAKTENEYAIAARKM